MFRSIRRRTGAQSELGGCSLTPNPPPPPSWPRAGACKSVNRLLRKPGVPAALKARADELYNKWILNPSFTPLCTV
jgi:hypothetical protein